MFITQVLCIKKIKWAPKVRPHGNLWRGKDRLVRPVTKPEIQHTKNVLDIEEKNMFYLRHPYLTRDEYRYVGRDFLKTKEKFKNGVWERHYEKFRKTIEHRTIDSYFRKRILLSNQWE